MSESHASRGDSIHASLVSHRRLVALGLTTTLLITLVALASRPFVGSSAEGPANTGPALAIFHLVVIVGLAVELLVLFLLVVLLRPARRRRKDDEFQLYLEPVRVHWAVKFALIVCPLLILGASIFALARWRGAEQATQPTPIALVPLFPATGGSLGGQARPGLELGWWDLGIAVLLAGLALVAILRAVRMPPPTKRLTPPLQQVSALASAVSAGLRDAQSEPDPRRAVIAAYASMEELLAAQGLPRRRVEAPLEYMTRLFGELDISDTALRTLTELFELARFSHHAISPSAREQAIAALATIEQELQAAP